VVGASTSNHAAVEQNGTADLCPTDDGSFVWIAEPFIDLTTHRQIGSFLQNVHSGLCMQMLNGRADQTVCSRGDHAQAWTFNFLRRVGDDTFSYNTVQNFHSGKCLHVVTGSTAAGARLDEVACANFNSDHAVVWFPF
jgi:hypothetical protein